MFSFGACMVVCFFFFKQKTAYEMRISDWSSDVCSSDLGNLDILARGGQALDRGAQQRHLAMHRCQPILDPRKRTRRIAVCLRIVETLIHFLPYSFLPALFYTFIQPQEQSNLKEQFDPNRSTATTSPYPQPYTQSYKTATLKICSNQCHYH